MNPKHGDKKYLEHILECIDLISVHLKTGGGGKQGFLQHVTVKEAVLRTLQVMSESTQRLSSAAKASAPEIEWQDISDFRNVLAHEYLGDLDLEIVWKVIEQKLPDLQASIQRIYKAYK